MKILAVIGARGGSKGVPGKNIRPIAGKPLIGWAIETALAMPEVTDMIVSTDDQDIADTAKAHGAKIPFMRPAELATSASGKFDVWKHALAECEKLYDTTYDFFLDIDCTSPLLDADDLSSMLKTFIHDGAYKNCDGMFTVSPSHRSPYFNLVEEDKNGYLALSKKLDTDIESRQASPKTLDIVAGFYLFNAQYIRTENQLLNGKLKGFEVPREKSFDIDESFDAELVTWLMERKHGAPE